MRLITLIFLLLLNLLCLETAFARSKFTPPDPLYALTIITNPKDAITKIMNIRPKYYHGIKLKSGHYRVQVSAQGYQPQKLRVAIRHQDEIMQITLAEKQSPLTNNHFDRLADNSTNVHMVALQPSDNPASYSRTPGYKGFLRHADRLKGVSFFDEKKKFSKYCKRYANLAVRQANRRVEEGCSDIITPFNNDAARQWSLNKAPQEAWCKTVSTYATSNETIYREGRLMDCLN
ncbi:MAG: hypothetical protein KAG34_11455 [Cocleimonas sp.]|nr:hypothetical protein [Cocleimonas sp.]